MILVEMLYKLVNHWCDECHIALQICTADVVLGFVITDKYRHYCDLVNQYTHSGWHVIPKGGIYVPYCRAH